MGNFTQLVKYQKSKGKGNLKSLGSALKGKTLENADPRNYLFNREGLLAALFPGLKGYRPQQNIRHQGAGMAASMKPMEDSLRTIASNISIVAKNSMALPRMERDINIMRQGIIKLVRLAGGSQENKADRFFKATSLKENEYESKFNKDSTTPTKTETTEKDSGGLADTLMKGLMVGGLLVGGITAYFKSPEFQKTVNDMTNSLGSALLGSDWDSFKKGIQETFDSIIATVKDNVGLIVVGLGLLLNPIDSLKLAVTSISTVVTGLVKFLLSKGVGKLIPGMALAEDLVNPTETVSQEQETAELKKYVPGYVDTSHLTEIKPAEERKKELQKQIVEANTSLQTLQSQRLQAVRSQGPEAGAAFNKDIREAKKKEQDLIYKESLQVDAPDILSGKAQTKDTTPEAIKQIDKKNINAYQGPEIQKKEKPVKKTEKAGNSQQVAMKFFKEKGWSEQESAAIVGNLVQESGLDTTAHNKKEDARGIGQWRLERHKKFKDQIGKDIFDASLEEQLKFVDWELKNTHKHAGEALKKTKTLEEATAVVDSKYEVSAGTHLAARIQNAKGLMGGTEGGTQEQTLASTKDTSTPSIPTATPKNNVLNNYAQGMWGNRTGTGNELIETQRDINNLKSSPMPPIIIPQQKASEPQQREPMSGQIASVTDNDFMKLLLGKSLGELAELA